ncbi:MarR family winged helix-turn-helix transcriptional regulator [Roseobacter sp. OBYS 0001]|uniref:MarR family winged helix-turn-helix transcriptional regulator n=1 Tax=Roseobacter sp. OBYS 0001 TaxID=882651 RepID=UPI001BB99BCC|nr:MarR family winged helix-turn-helix transcriptional regulator [Roseobacter sp. OBYS 0001]GIT88759.1 MarR family transcriptional regulator [Roseobacter sp. OBYS 0001]
MTSSDFNLSEFLPYKLSVLSSRISKMLSKVYGAEYGLSTPEWRVLVHVARREKMSVREIHDSVYLEKPSVSRAVTKLEKAGLLAKSTCDADHRLVEIEVTASGLDVFNGIVPAALSFENALMSTFSDAERDQFNTLMERLHDVLDTQPGATRRPQVDDEVSKTLPNGAG